MAEGQAESGDDLVALITKSPHTAKGHGSSSPAPLPKSPTSTADNRPIAFPYSKLMVANSSVNQGAALIVTSLALAREAGIDGGPAGLYRRGRIGA